MRRCDEKSSTLRFPLDADIVGNSAAATTRRAVFAAAYRLLCQCAAKKEEEAYPQTQEG